MKVSCHILLLVCVFVMPGVSIGQTVSDDMLDAAKAQFEKAYQAECGVAPSVNDVKRAMNQYKLAVASLPATLGSQAGKEARRRASLRKGLDNISGLELVEVLETMRFKSLADFAFTPEKIEELAKPEMAVNQIDGRLLVRKPELIHEVKDNTEIVFPEGTYTIDERKISTLLMLSEKKFPEGVSFVGAAKEATTLRITDVGLTRSNVDKLSFRDMTIDCNNDGLFDKRSGGLTLQMSNCRLVRFDAGHGGCRLFSVNDGLIVHAKNCEFIGGFGRSPGRGDVFDSVDILLGYFEGCSFFGIDYDLFRPLDKRRALLHMKNCKFDRKSRDNAAVLMDDSRFDAKPKNFNWKPEADTEISIEEG